MAENESNLDQKAIDNIKASIKAIEGLFHACNAASFPLKWHESVIIGMKFMNEMHSQLISQLPPDVLAKEKAEQEALAKSEAPVVVN